MIDKYKFEKFNKIIYCIYTNKVKLNCDIYVKFSYKYLLLNLNNVIFCGASGSFFKYFNNVINKHN